jgi:hypothetical protein
MKIKLFYRAFKMMFNEVTDFEVLHEGLVCPSDGLLAKTLKESPSLPMQSLGLTIIRSQRDMLFDIYIMRIPISASTFIPNLL